MPDHYRFPRRGLRHALLSLPVLAGVALLGASPVLAAEPSNMAALRAQALELVNRSRAAQDLDPLRPGENLDEAAQAHAADMLRRDYFAHEAPDGSSVRDRYIEAGGAPPGLIAENIGRCTGCGPQVEAARIRRFHEGFMASTGHRENILRRGLDRFGFGVAVQGGQIAVVQTFAGPGPDRPRTGVRQR
ncbi:CAP domain-containing protein [Roseomonas frigidaquae]|uniref:CAP domain-containing protein n=1 Tax=Falsiroseomonas frigidaquae TaxID=487318 RepID=A0ABX1F286_9PROT|nr:CAP domain-containing protein [Falsiroseomonas frigidaquae]NKE46457.1 CAP domain-containing protein [Falsiroseomonas frigidaquae]